jgi:hypothetical protein
MVEKSIASVLGAVLVNGSGCGRVKGDMITRNFYIQHKFKKSDKPIIRTKEILDLIYDANVNSDLMGIKHPAMIVTVAGDTHYVIIPKHLATCINRDIAVFNAVTYTTKTINLQTLTKNNTTNGVYGTWLVSIFPEQAISLRYELVIISLDNFQKIM